MPTGKHRQQALLNPERTQLGIRRQAFLSGRPIYLSNKNLRLYLFLPITTAGYCIHIGFWHDRYVLGRQVHYAETEQTSSSRFRHSSSLYAPTYLSVSTVLLLRRDCLANLHPRSI
jgi:hypothetical protein